MPPLSKHPGVRNRVFSCCTAVAAPGSLREAVQNARESVSVRMLCERPRSARAADRLRRCTVSRCPLYELEQLFECLERQQLAARVEALFQRRTIFQEL